MDFRLHFTDASMAAMEPLGLDQDAVRTAINAGTKLQVGENLIIARHEGLEVEVWIEGPDYHVRALRREQAWPRAPATHPYVAKMRGGA